MKITKKIVADKLLGYLQHDIALAELVNWSENAIMEGEYSDKELTLLNEVLGKIGLADVKMFGLSWEDCSEIMKMLGYELKVEALRAA